MNIHEPVALEPGTSMIAAGDRILGSPERSDQLTVDGSDSQILQDLKQISIAWTLLPDDLKTTIMKITSVAKHLSAAAKGVHELRADSD